jgi:ribosome modulation factor
LPVELEVGCEAEPEVAPEGEREPDELDPPADELPPAVDEPPPAVDAPLAAVLLDLPPQDDDAENGDDDRDEEERARSGGFPAGTASESTNTSPRMCSTNCAGTPDWFTGWVNTRCTPVAVTVSSLAPEFAPPPIGSNGLGAAVVFV